MLTEPLIDGFSLLSISTDRAVYRSQAGGAITVPILYAPLKIQAEKRNGKDYQLCDTYAFVYAPAIGDINAMDTLVSETGIEWTVEEFDTDPTSGICTLALHSEHVIDRHRRQTSTLPPPTGELADGGVIGQNWRIGQTPDDAYQGGVGTGRINETYKIGKST